MYVCKHSTLEYQTALYFLYRSENIASERHMFAGRNISDD